MKAELRRDDDLVADRRQCLSYKNFIREGTIDLRRVKERNAHFNCLVHQFDHLFLVMDHAIREAHAHAAKADCRDFECVSKFALLHHLSRVRAAPLHSESIDGLPREALKISA